MDCSENQVNILHILFFVLYILLKNNLSHMRITIKIVIVLNNIQ